jgi:hypothetical protein
VRPATSTAVSRVEKQPAPLAVSMMLAMGNS